jgi:hypothetical protein
MPGKLLIIVILAFQSKGEQRDVEIKTRLGKSV